MSLIGILKSILQRLGVIADYVVEQGESGIWTYRKWASGIAEIWNTELFNVTGSSTSGALMGGYYAQLTNPSWGSFPFTFVSPPTASGVARLSTGVGFLSPYCSKTKITTVTCVGNQSSRAINDISIHLIGKWK